MQAGRARLNSSIALEKLRERIRDHQIDGDPKLPSERELAAAMGLGRRAVRRAMEVLEAEGLVWRQQGKGTFIGGRPSAHPHFIGDLSERTNPLEVMEARLQIEPPLARIAALRGSPEDFAALEKLAKKASSSLDDDAWELWDSAFHRKIAECAGNGLMLALFDLVQRIRQEPYWRYLRGLARTQEHRENSHRDHAEIVAMITARDGAGAERAMRRHLAAVNASLQAIIAGEVGGASVPSTDERTVSS